MSTPNANEKPGGGGDASAPATEITAAQGPRDATSAQVPPEAKKNATGVTTESKKREYKDFEHQEEAATRAFPSHSFFL